MLLLTSTSDLLRVVTASAVTSIEVHASFVDISAGVVTPGRTNTTITTATTTTVVASPAASTQRNVKGLYVTNNSSAPCVVSVIHTDGTTVVELIQYNLLPGENLQFDKEGVFIHRDANGAEYPPAGLGAYDGRTVPFMKSGTAADVAGAWYCTSKDAGFPGAWAVGTPGVNGRVTDGLASADFGCLPLVNPSVGANYLTSLSLGSAVAHTHMFFDVLWVNTGLTVTTTTNQAITCPTLPARDVNGTTNGEGCIIGLLVTGTLGNAAAVANSTVTYTNSAGTGSRTGSLIAVAGSQIPQTALVGTIVWFALAAGDKGVRTLDGVTLATTLTSGTISMIIARPVLVHGTPVANASHPIKFESPGVRVYNNSCILHCYLASATTATFVAGGFTVAEK